MGGLNGHSTLNRNSRPSGRSILCRNGSESVRSHYSVSNDLMDSVNVYYDSRGMILLELDGAGLELTREEAEELFVRLGHTLQDMDVANQEDV